MKKILIYILVVIGICFIIPIFFTTKFKIKEIFCESEEKEEKIIQDIEKYSYSDFKTIKLLHKESGEVEEKPLDEYIAEVVSAEIPANYDVEAIKAQSVSARTYTIYKIIHGLKHENADICDDYACCQAWISKDDRLSKWKEGERIDNWNKIVEAVNSTIREVATYDGQIINAFFHSNSGGVTETASNVWGGEDFPYLKSVETSGEDAYTQYSSEVSLTEEELLNKLKAEYSDIEIDFANEESIKIIDYTESNRVKTVKFGNKEISGVEARRILGLKSTNFNITKNDGKIIFSVVGNGHGVGLSQTGADALAKQGFNYQEILKHFYTGIEITKLD